MDAPGRFDTAQFDSAGVVLFGAESGVFRSAIGFWGNAEANGLLVWAPISTVVNQDFGRMVLTNTRTATGDAWNPSSNGGVYTGVSGLIQYYAEFPALRHTVPAISAAAYAGETDLPAPPLVPGNVKLFARRGKAAYGYAASPTLEMGLSFLSRSIPSGSTEEDVATFQRADGRYNEPRVAQIHIDSLDPNKSVYPFVAATDLTVTSITLLGDTTLSSPALILGVYNMAAVSPGYLFAVSPSSTVSAGAPAAFVPDQYQVMAAGDWLDLSWSGSASPLINLTICVAYQPVYPV